MHKGDSAQRSRRHALHACLILGDHMGSTVCGPEIRNITNKVYLGKQVAMGNGSNIGFQSSEFW